MTVGHLNVPATMRGGGGIGGELGGKTLKKNVTMPRYVNEEATPSSLMY